MPKIKQTRVKQRLRGGRVKRLHINQHVIRANRKNGETNPVITCKTSKQNYYGHEVSILDDGGKEVARVVYRPDKPLSCGAHVWIELKSAVEVLVHD